MRPVADVARNPRKHVGVYIRKKVTELPVMRSIKFEFVINLKTARVLGLDIPPMLLAPSPTR
jgi:hypothetical protein